MRRIASILAGSLFAAQLLACATPIGVTEVDRRHVFRELATNAVISDQPSASSRQVLLRLGLADRMSEDPEATLATLHAGTLAAPDVDPAVTADRLYALAEYSFLHAFDLQSRCGASAVARTRGPSLARADRTASEDACRRASGYFVAASVYAYAFLFQGGGDAAPSALDPRTRNAVDLYNLAVTSAIRQPPGHINPTAVETDFHLGHLSLSLDPAQFRYADRRLGNFVPATRLAVRGLRNRYRQAGIGAPFIANLLADESTTVALTSARVADSLRVPITIFVRYDDVLAGLRSRSIRGSIEIYNEHETRAIEVAGRTVPLEYETTAALAYSLEHSDLWAFEIAGFLHGDALPRADGLVMMEPYRRGAIPVVLVHGTASSPLRWAEMLNELRSDPLIRDRYQFWLFIYTTGNPILYSASLLRQSLRNTLAEVDPDGTDPALRRMVVAGHSQGGLLTKLQAIASGNRFWRELSDRPFDEVEMGPETREILREALFFEPQPYVESVVFISTPHRGSFLAEMWMGALASRLFSAPQRLANLSLDLARAGIAIPGRAAAAASSLFGGEPDPDVALRRRLARLPSSVDNMDPNLPFIQKLQAIPVDARIAAHSIIPVLGGPPAEGQNDGVVEYSSAHIDEAKSEYIVYHSGHSTQGNPETIQEMRRILLEHASAR